MKNDEITELVETTLESMIGHRYMYGATNHTITRYRINKERGRVTVITDKKEFDRPIDAAMEFLEQFEPIPGRAVAVVQDQPNLPQMQVNSSVISELKDVLMDNIRKVKEDKNYIEQAEAVRQNVESVIGLAKTEIAYMEAYTRMNKL